MKKTVTIMFGKKVQEYQKKEYLSMARIHVSEFYDRRYKDLNLSNSSGNRSL